MFRRLQVLARQANTWRSFSTTAVVKSHGVPYGGYKYRQPKIGAEPKYYILAEVLGGFMWWWILWHLFTEPEHVFGGEWDIPDPTKWTDEELGIPPDDAD